MNKVILAEDFDPNDLKSCSIKRELTRLDEGPSSNELFQSEVGWYGSSVYLPVPMEDHKAPSEDNAVRCEVGQRRFSLHTKIRWSRGIMFAPSKCTTSRSHRPPKTRHPLHHHPHTVTLLGFLPLKASGVRLITSLEWASTGKTITRKDQTLLPCNIK